MRAGQPARSLGLSAAAVTPSLTGRDNCDMVGIARALGHHGNKIAIRYDG